MDRYLYEDYELRAYQTHSQNDSKGKIDEDTQIDEELRKIELTMPSK